MMPALKFHYRSVFSCLRWTAKMYSVGKQKKGQFSSLCVVLRKHRLLLLFWNVYYLMFRLFHVTKFGVRFLGKGRCYIITKSLNKLIFSTRNHPLIDLIRSHSHPYSHKHQDVSAQVGWWESLVCSTGTCTPATESLSCVCGSRADLLHPLGVISS